MDERFGREAVETDEYINHPAVCKTDLITDRIELSVERHCALAVRTARNLITLQKVGIAPLVALLDFLPRASSPPI
jgi:hypothetical protein